MYKSEPPSNSLHAWQQWALLMEQRMREQQALIEQLQQELNQVKLQLSKHDQAKVFHVEKIEYHFDQLKVDTLEGSLQIGLSTSNPEQLPMMIEDIAMKQQAEQQAPHANFPYGPYVNGNSSHNKAYPNSSSQIAKPNANLYNRTHPKHQQKNIEHDNQTKSDLIINEELVDQCLQEIGQLLEQNMERYIQRQSSLFKLELTEEHVTLMIEDLHRQMPARVHYYLQEQQRNSETNTTETEIKQYITRLTLNDIEQAIDQYLYSLAEQEEKS